MAPVAVFLVINNLERLPELLEAWAEAGIPGATVLQSAGLHCLRTCKYRDDLPLIPSLDSLLRGSEESNRTCFAIADDTEVDAIIAATEAALGKLDAPNTGILFVVPLLRVVGLVRWEGK
jgi:nitrogen regulatory protein P-II 1